MKQRSLTTRWATLRPSPCKIDGKLVMMEGPGPGSTTKDDNNSLCRTCSTTRFPSTCSPMSASPTSAEVDPILRLWWCEMNGMALMPTGGCITVGLGQQPLWWTLACRPAIQMGRCDSSSAEVDPLLERRWTHFCGAGGPDDDPTAPFRGPPSVSPSPSIADDDDMRGADGGGPSDNAVIQAILAEPMDDGQDQPTLLPTPAGSVMEPMEEPPGQQATPHGRLPPPALLPEGQPLPATTSTSPTTWTTSTTFSSTSTSWPTDFWTTTTTT